MFLGFLAGAALAAWGVFLPRLAALAGVFLIALLFRSRKYAVIPFVLAGAVIFMLSPSGVPQLPENKSYTPKVLEGYYVSPPGTTASGYAQDFKVTGGEAGDITRIRVLSDQAYEPGVRYRLLVRLINASDRKNPGYRAWPPFAVVKHAERVEGGHAWYLALPARLRAHLNVAIAERFDPREAALIAAVTTGGRLDGLQEIRVSFQGAGLAHVLSISGMHFGFFGLMLFALIRALLTRLPLKQLEALTARLTPSEAAALMTIPFMLGYLLLSGGRAPSVRAFLMTGMFLLGLLLGRHSGWLNFLAFAGFVIVALDPSALTSLSFQMSFLAVLFIGNFMIRPDLFEREALDLAPWWRRALRYPGGLLLVTLAATMGVAPLAAYHFNYASMISPAANLIAGPLVSMALVPLSLGGAMEQLLYGGSLLWEAAGPVAGSVLWLADAFSGLPHASLPVASYPAGLLVLYYAGFAVWFRWRSRRWLLVLPFVPFALYALVGLGAREGTRVTFLDAGRSDTSVVELAKDGGVFLIDTERSGREAAAFLRRRGIREIDALILSHGHADHAGGADRIARDFKVAGLWHSGWLDIPDSGPLSEIPVRVLARGDVVNGPGFDLLVLHPYEEFGAGWGSNSSTRVNDLSLVFRLTSQGAGFLFTGDVEAAAAADMSAVPSRWIRSDVLKAPHHGKNKGALETLLRAASPRVVVIPAPAEPRSLPRYLLKGRHTYVTGRDGAVSVLAQDGKVSVSTYGDSMLLKGPSFMGELSNLRRLFVSWP